MAWQARGKVCACAFLVKLWMLCDLGVEVGEGVVRQGLVEGVPVEVLLDTGSAWTLVRRNLCWRVR